MLTHDNRLAQSIRDMMPEADHYGEAEILAAYTAWRVTANGLDIEELLPLLDASARRAAYARLTRSAS